MPYRDISKKRASQKRYREKKKRLGYRLTWVGPTLKHDRILKQSQLPMSIKRKRPAGYRAKEPYSRR